MPPKDFSNRVVRAVGIRAGPRSCVIVERKGRDHLISALALAAPFAIYYGTGAGGMPDAGRIVLTLVGGVLALAVLWSLFPRNVRIRADFDEEKGELVWRFLFVPLKRLPVDLEGCIFAWGHGELRYTREVHDDAKLAWGCVLGAIFGPLAALFTSSSKTLDTREDAQGIVLRDRQSGVDQFLLAVRDQGSVEDVLLILAQLYGRA